MGSNDTSRSLGRACVLMAACVLLGMPAAFGAAEKEKSTADYVNIAKNHNQPSLARVNAIEKLGALTEPASLRNDGVSDALLGIAKGPDDLFVRVAAIRTLGKLQVNADKLLKGTFIPVLNALLKDQKEHAMVRKTVAQVYTDTLQFEAKDHQGISAFMALMDVAKNKNDVEGLRVAVIKAIGAFGSPEGLDVLVGLLSEASSRTREEAAGALFDLLSRMSGEAPIPVPAINKLIEMVADKNMAAELRVNVMKVLAQLMRDGNMQASRAMPVIIEMVKRAEDIKLVKGGIQALGLIGSAEAVEPLKVAYKDFLPAGGAAPAAPKADAEAPKADGAAAAPVEQTQDSEVRKIIMEALSSVLSTQGNKEKGQPDMKAVHEAAVLLVKAVDDDPSTTVKEAAIFALGYLHYVKFKAEQAEAISSLIYLARQPGTADTLKQRIFPTLEAITGQDFGPDAKRWDDWAQKTGGKVKK